MRFWWLRGFLVRLVGGFCSRLGLWRFRGGCLLVHVFVGFCRLRRLLEPWFLWRCLLFRELWCWLCMCVRVGGRLRLGCLVRLRLDLALLGRVFPLSYLGSILNLKSICPL